MASSRIFGCVRIPIGDSLDKIFVFLSERPQVWKIFLKRLIVKFRKPTPHRLPDLLKEGDFSHLNDQPMQTGVGYLECFVVRSSHGRIELKQSIFQIGEPGIGVCTLHCGFSRGKRLNLSAQL